MKTVITGIVAIVFLLAQSSALAADQKSSPGPSASGLASKKPAASKKKAMKPVMPIELRGIWSDNDADGRSQCHRYKSAAKHRRDDDSVSISLIGSLVITKNLIHAYSEYGEGDFYGVTRIVPAGRNKWQITAQVSIDTLPSEEDKEDLETFRLDLISKILYWKNYESENHKNLAADDSPGYFKCAPLTKEFSDGYDR